MKCCSHLNSNNKLIEIQSKRLSALISCLLNKRSNISNDVRCTSFETKNKLIQRIHKNNNSKFSSSSVYKLTTRPTVQVDAYFRFLCNRRRWNFKKYHQNENDPLNRNTSRNTNFNKTVCCNQQQQQQQHKTHTNNRDDDYDKNNNEWYIQLVSHCYRNGFEAHINYLNECSKQHSILQRESAQTHNHLRILSSTLLPRYKPIKSIDSLNSIVSCVSNIGVYSSSKSVAVALNCDRNFISSFNTKKKIKK